MNSYILPTTASTTIGTLSTTTYAASTSGSPVYSLVTTGNDNSGLACPSTTDFSVSGATLSTSSTYSPAAHLWGEYVCVKSAFGSSTFTQRMMLNTSTPRFTKLQAIGGSQTATGAYPTYWQQLGPAYGWAVTGRGSSSPLYACGAAIGTFIADATGSIGTTGNPMFSVLIGEDDAYNFGAGSYESVFKDCLTADLAWLSYPSKVLATSATQGSNNHWSAYSTTGLSSGTVLQSSTAGDSLTFTVNVTKGIANVYSVPTGVIYVWVGALNSDGTAQVSWSLDSGAQTGTTTLDDYQTAVGVQAIRIGTLSIGSHTVAVTISTLGTATSGIIVAGAGTAGTTYADQVAVGGVLKQNGNANATATQDYDTDLGTVVMALDSDFMDVMYAPVRNYVNTITDYSSTLGLNASGHVHLTQAFQENWYPCIVGAVDVNRNPVTPPSQAATNGFTCLKFDDEGTTTATVDTGNTLNPGYNWYTVANWPNSGEDSPSPWGSFTTTPSLPWNSGQVTTGSNGLSVSASNSTHGAPVLSSCAPTAGAHATSEYQPFLVGKQFSGANGFYVEDQMYWPGGSCSTGEYFTAWWEPTEQLNHQVGAPGTWLARAFIESDNPDEGVCNNKEWLWKSISGTTSGPIDGLSITSNIATSGVTYGQLWLASDKTSTGHTRQWFYFNNVPQSEQLHDEYFDDEVEEHQCMQLNFAASQSAAERFFRFWQDPL